MPGGESTRSTFSMDANLPFFSVNSVDFFFSNVMADIVDQIHIQISRAKIQCLLKDFSCPVGKHLSISPGIIGSTSHTGIVLLAHFGFEIGTNKLSVRKLDIHLTRFVKHCFNKIITHLIAEPTRPGMNGDNNLVLEEVKGTCSLLIINFINNPYLQKVIT